MKGGCIMNMNEVIAGVTLTKACSIKADADSEQKKTINLKVKFDGALLKGVFDKALAGTVIAWQNGVGRKNFDKYVNNQVVEITFTSPASNAVDPETAMVAKLQAMTAEEQQAYIAELVAKSKK
jgi:acyl-coenzyme A thioesterase PaaI-like protein